MKISVITSVYNNRAYIAEAIESVLSQSYKNVEFIVIDGGSSDGTTEIIRKYADSIDAFVSEPDRGIYDGLNKGIEKATGDVIGFLHSDDLFENDRVLETIATVFSETGTDSVYGDLTYVRKENPEQIVRYWKSGPFSRKRLILGWMPPHPTFYVKKEVYERYGAFDLSFKIAADYDTILRFLGRHQISTAYIPKVLVKMRVGGESNKSLRNLYRKSREDYRALRQNGIGGLSTLLWKNFSKVGQFFTKPKD